MSIDKHKKISYLLFIIPLLLFSTCSPKFSHGVKSFMFDGVPTLYEVDVSAIEDSLHIINSGSTNELLGSTVSRNEFNIHPPYKDKECKKCHNRDMMGKPIIIQTELCNQCHKPFNETFSVLHGPVGFGNCTICHNPHKSKNRNLLVDTGQDLCFICHNTSLVLASKSHEEMKDDLSCTECHDPHGGDNDKFLIN